MTYNLEKEWSMVTKDFPKPECDWWWGLILEKYNESGREAHSLKHLESKFSELNTFRQNLYNLQAFILALFFQYFHCDPRDGELSSKNVESFEKFASETGLSQDDLYRSVKNLLEASSIYSAEEHKSEGDYGDDDIHYFLDLDIFTLGRESDEYTQNTRDIAMEYSFLDAPSYKNLRRKVLQSFLLIPNIFATRLFREKYESSARQNIQDELEKLKS